MKLSILLSSAGRRVELLKLFREEAAQMGIDLTIVAADHNPPHAAACHFADSVEAVPTVDAENYSNVMLGILERHGISVVVPLIDADVTAWAAMADVAVKQHGCKVATSSPQAVAICRDKALTTSALRSAGLPVPWTRRAEEFDWMQVGTPWPLICKPVGGSSSVGIRLIADAEIARISPPEPGTIVQERLTGDEATVNVFYDRSGALLYAVPHWRRSVRSGEVSRGTTFRHADLEDAARRIGRALPGVWGAHCFQAMVNRDGSFAIFEINARFGGGYPLAHHAGALGVRYLLEDAIGRPLAPVSTWQDGLTMLRYDQSIFVTQ